MTHDSAAAAPEINLGTLAQMNFAMAPTRILLTAVQLDVFSHIAAGKTTAAEVAAAAQASLRGTRMLLNALCALQLLVKNSERYGLHPASRQFLVRSSPDYMGYMFENDGIWESWGNLTESVRTGKPAFEGHDQPTAEAFFSVLVRSLHVMNRDPARQLAQAVSAGSQHHGRRVLDVACGSGVWGIALAEADPQAKVTFQDLPGVLDVTRGYVDRSGMAGRHEFLPGDLNTAEYPASKFDLAVLGNICHSAGEVASRKLFSCIFGALQPGGRIVIVETMPAEDRSGPVFPIVFALNMLLHTESGDTYTAREYRAWLTEAGYVKIETVPIGLNSPAIFGSKPTVSS